MDILFTINLIDISMLKRILFIAILFIASTPAVKAQNPADRILGTYYVIEPTSKEESKVQIYKAPNGTYFGKVIWMKNPNMPDGTPKRDIKNPDPSLRSTRGDQIVLVKNFTYNSKNGEWVNGEIYNPVEGKTYKCKMAFESDTKLKVRGYIGVPALGRSMYWKKL